MLADALDKRSVVPIEPQLWDQWLQGNKERAPALIKLSDMTCIAHGAVDQALEVALPIC